MKKFKVECTILNKNQIEGYEVYNPDCLITVCPSLEAENTTEAIIFAMEDMAESIRQVLDGVDIVSGEDEITVYCNSSPVEMYTHFKATEITG